MFYVGIPCMYYGDELPLEGGYDPDCRRCMDFTKANKNNSFFNIYKKLIHLRKTNKIVKYGELSVYVENNLIVFKRQYKGKVIKLILNNTADETNINGNNVLVGNNYNVNTLYPDGFIIIKETEE